MYLICFYKPLVASFRMLQVSTLRGERKWTVQSTRASGSKMARNNLNGTCWRSPLILSTRMERARCCHVRYVVLCYACGVMLLKMVEA